MASNFQLQLRSASFRGVPFSVQAADVEVGRRTVLHQYPTRDEPFVEDVGKNARHYNVTAFLVGGDYIQKVKKLIEAVEKPGAGKLVHPWLGEVTVTVAAQSQVSFDTSLGVATVSLTFIEAGKLDYPKASKSWLATVRANIDSLISSASDAFAEAFHLEDVSDFVRNDALDTFEACRSALLTNSAVGGVAEIASSLRDLSASVLSTSPKAFADAFLTATNFSALSGIVRDWRKSSESLAKLSNSQTFSQKSTAGLTQDTSEMRIVKNQNAITELVRASLIANAAGAETLTGGETDESLSSYDAIVSARDAILSAIDDEILRTTSDDVAESLEELRASVFEDATERARDNARLVTISPQPKTPLLVVAYEKYADAERADEIQKLSNVRHAGFSPAGGLKVLSR